MKISVIGAHADDEALLAGATIHKLSHMRPASKDGVSLPIIKKSSEVSILCFSDRHTQPDPSSPEEFQESCSILGVNPYNAKLLDYIAIKFPTFYQEIRKSLEYYRKETFDPDIVITHPLNDLHQDHRVISQEVCSVFRDRSVLFGEFGNSDYSGTPNFFVPVEMEDIKAKVAALESYKSQKGKLYLRGESIRGQAAFRGTMIRVPYAEAYQVFRWIPNW